MPKKTRKSTQQHINEIVERFGDANYRIKIINVNFEKNLPPNSPGSTMWSPVFFENDSPINMEEPRTSGLYVSGEKRLAGSHRYARMGRGYTLIAAYGKDDKSKDPIPYAVGRSICSSKDNFCKKTGIIKALLHLAEQMKDSVPNLLARKEKELIS